jgi:glycosyltransferase involved in cell wall biosynthesis
MRKLRIAQIAPPFLPIPPENYGGIEAVVSHLTEELVKRGHDVTLFASGNSKTSAKLVSAFHESLHYEQLENMLSPLAQKLNWMYSLPFFYHAVQAFENAGDFDIIHDHTHYLSCFFSNFVKTPMVSTYHGSFTLAEQSPIEKLILQKYKRNNWVAISNSQKNETNLGLKFVGTVHNSLHINDYLYNEKPENYLVWLGRITDRKGILEAIHVAKSLDKKLIITGNVKDRDKEFYKDQIEPSIDNKQIIYDGPSDLPTKVKLLRNAKALLYPVKWNEPFGMVMIESMSVGTPVIGYANGAVPEVIKDGVTGYVVKDLKSMTSKTKKIFSMTDTEYIKMRKNARVHIEKKFTVEKMVDTYENIYSKLL